ncbi:hypothetical protein KAR91_08460 [Candidatus Pacearchaeota archaeon]|nr:hypothetical protein [Candidatus Pacearchaeota archaeon]
MTKKDKNSFSEYVAEKQKIEKRLEDIRGELDSPEIGPGAISKMEMTAGEERLRFESFLSRYNEVGSPKNRRSELHRLEYVFKAAKERSLAAKAKRNSLVTEKDELKHTLSEMSCQFAKGELAVILQINQEAENEKAVLLKTIAEHEEKKEVLQQDFNATKTAIDHLKMKRQDVLAGMATGTNKISTSLDSVDSEINETAAAQNTAHQSLKNAEDTIEGLKALFVDAEQKAEAQRADAKEAVALYLFDRAKIAGEKYSKAAAQLGQLFAELQALTDVLNDISVGGPPVGISVLDAHRLYVPTFLIGRDSAVNDFNGLLNQGQIEIPPVVQTEKDNLKEMGFIW